MSYIQQAGRLNRKRPVVKTDMSSWGKLMPWESEPASMNDIAEAMRKIQVEKAELNNSGWGVQNKTWADTVREPKITLDDHVPLPPGEYVASIEPVANEAAWPVKVSNFRPHSSYKTWGRWDDANVALAYLIKHETEGWKFKVENAPTAGRFVIAAVDGWGDRKGWI